MISFVNAEKWVVSCCGQVFWSCVALLEAAYVAAFAFGVTSSVVWSRVAMV